MNKNKIDDLLKIAEELKASKAERDKDAAAARQNVEKAKAYEQAAATSGDLAAYISAKADRIAAEEKAFVMEQYAKNFSGGVDPEKIKATWREYADEHNKEFSKALTQYENARHTLSEAYKTLLSLQNKALLSREACGQLLGLPCDALGKMIFSDNLANILLLTSDLDYEFFLETKEFGQDLAQACFDVVTQQRPSSQI